MTKRLILTTLVGAVLLFALGSGPVGAQSGGLTRLLGQVPDAPFAQTAIWYGAPGDLENQLGVQVNSQDDLNGLGPAQRVSFLFEFGLQVYYSSYSGVENAAGWQQAFGINPFSIQRELTVGASATEQFGILEGALDANTISQTLSANGYQIASLGGASVFTFGGDNDTNAGFPSQIASARFNRVFVDNGRVIAAPNDGVLASVLGGGAKLVNNALFGALASVLELPATAPGTALLSAALFDGSHLIDEVLTPAFNDSGASRAALGLNSELPRYQGAALGYRRGSSSRALVLVLAYRDDGSAQQASAVMLERLNNYASMTDAGRRLFEGWAFQAATTNLNGLSVAVIVGSLPDQTDVGWVQLTRARDVMFLLP